MLRVLVRLARLVVGRFRRGLTRLRYSGLQLGRRVTLDITGRFCFGQGCVVSEGASVIVPQHAELLLGKGCYVGRYAELGPRGAIEIGSGTSIQDRSILVGDVKVGRHCLLSYNVLISSGRHYYSLFPTWLIKDQDNFVVHDESFNAAHSRPVIIEDDCWLGINSVVMPGVTIGKGAVVGANSVVTRDVYPYTIVAGAPARVIKKRLDFVPPRSIVCDNPDDWPYFYSGCEMSQVALAKYVQYGGVAAGGDFVICLDASAGASIHLEIKSTQADKVHVAFGDEIREISNQFAEIVFGCTEQSVLTKRFRMRANVGEAKFIINKAWIE